MLGLKFNIYKVSAFIIVFLFAFLSSNAQAIELQPVYAAKMNMTGRSNHSYLDDVHNGGLLESINQTLPVNPNRMLSSADVNGMKQQYNDIHRDYDMRKNYGLANSELERTHLGQLADLSQSVIEQMKNNQISEQRAKAQPILDNLTNEIKKDEKIMAIATPVIIASTPVAFFFGRPLEFNVGGDNKFCARANGPAQTAQLNFLSHSFSGALELNGNAAESRNPTSSFLANPLGRGDERFKFSVSRPFSALKLNTSFAYISTSNVVDASVSKVIYPHVTLMVDAFYPMNADNSDVKAPGNAFKALYEIHF